jgi:CRISPR-associated exonuclease Cas4
MRVTGVMVQYYIACKRELWFFANQINMNYNNDDINIGRLIHEKSFSREKKNINLGDIVFDFVKTGDKDVIFEIKKSSKLGEPVRYQLYYYLWNAKKMGKVMDGMLVYPEERKREKIVLTQEKEEEMEKIILDIQNLVSQTLPPPVVIKPYCRRCTYYEMCMV